MTKFVVFDEDEIDRLSDDDMVVDVDKDGNKIIYLSKTAFDTYWNKKENTND